VAGGGTGLDFPCFLKFLVMIAYHALSKTNSFSSLYSTIEVGERGVVQALLCGLQLCGGSGCSLSAVA
jgi:hypothetical protein